jgi:hypothetical protein
MKRKSISADGRGEALGKLWNLVPPLLMRMPRPGFDKTGSRRTLSVGESVLLDCEDNIWTLTTRN